VGGRPQELGHEAIIAEREDSGIAGPARPVDSDANIRRGMPAMNWRHFWTAFVKPFHVGEKSTP
jgi:hypothetical protein